MSPYVTSAIIGGAIMFALQFVGLGFSDDLGGDVAPVKTAIIALH